MYQIVDFKNLFLISGVGQQTDYYYPFCKQFIYCHSDDHCFRNIFQEGRKLMGYYVRHKIKVAFYYKPSWYSRQKMYWIYGWSWEDAT